MGTVKKIAEFVDIPCTDNFIEDIVDKCNFRNIKENKIDDSTCILKINQQYFVKVITLESIKSYAYSRCTRYNNM